MRIVWIIVVIVVLSVCGYAAVFYHQRASSASYNLDNERYNRMLAEENLLKATRKLDAVESEIAKLKKTIETKEQILTQTDAVNTDLRKQLDRLIVTQQEMDQKLKAMMSVTVTPEQPATSPAGNM